MAHSDVMALLTSPAIPPALRSALNSTPHIPAHALPLAATQKGK
jgi:hypothetical protein